ncbi:MAG: HAMP domain-containing protein [Sphingomonadaceae bacterium]|nr:HAMP domain-containing protein [Sphingomonadaceae bacterium]
MATNLIDDDQAERSILRRTLSSLADALGNSQSIKLLEIGSAIMLVVVAGISAYILMDQGPQSEPLSPAASATMLVANLLPATMLLVLFGRRVALRRAERSGIDSQQLLHVRLVAIFSAITAVPTLLLVIFASLLFQSGVQFWFSGSARGMLENAGELAKGYYEVNARDVGDETQTMAGDFRNALNQTTPSDPAFLGYYIDQIARRRLSESAIVSVGPDNVQRTEAVFALDKQRQQNWISPDVMAKLQAGEGLVIKNSGNRIEAVTVLFDNPRSYLYASREITVPTFALGEKAQTVLDDYDELVARSRALQLQFNVALYAISLLIIGITLWIALRVADRLVRPINSLVDAAQRIADGDLSARVREDQYRADEIGFLSQSFNRMTERLEKQTGTLLTTNRQLGERRIFIETVLESVSAGVVSVNEDGTIELANSTADKMLSGESDTIVGQKFTEVAPELDALVRDRPRGVIQLGDGPEPVTVAVKASQRERGVVVTFEDISQQLADQRRAAWSDVARRIAHEIKNPLTPIQLAAERLQRRFGKQVAEDPAVFEQLTGTIIRQVGDLRKIVDEFSSFARMPKPVFRSENLNDIVGHAVFMFEVAHPDIAFNMQADADTIMLVADRRQLGQAITNILKNAAESIEERRKSDNSPGRIDISLCVKENRVLVRTQDNGLGLPSDRERILEPYITNRASGSGLGLAIVKKIVEEHFGEIFLEDAPGGGAIVTLMFQPETIAANAGPAAPAEPLVTEDEV